MRKSLTPVAAAVGAALLVGLGPALWKRLLPDKPPPIEYKVVVYSTAEKNPSISQASVELSIGTAMRASLDTDPQGVATFRIDSAHVSKAGRLRVVREGFEPRDKPIMVPLSSAQESVYLSPAAPPRPKEPVTRVFSSGPRPSGLGSGWAGPYEVCSEPPPNGYVVGATDFSLRGDRSCGAWSECTETQRSPIKVCWSFRLQGHDEWFPPRPAFSEGILKVSFVPQS